jgi:hypothetical protein
VLGHRPTGRFVGPIASIVWPTLHPPNTCSYARAMHYLRRRDTPDTTPWWAEVERYSASAPGIVRELLRGSSVVCDTAEAEQALAWARAHPARIEDPAPLYAHDPNAEQRP